MGLSGSKSKIDNVWPLQETEKEIFAQPDKDWWQRMKAKQKIIDAQIKKKHGR